MALTTAVECERQWLVSETIAMGRALDRAVALTTAVECERQWLVSETIAMG